MMRISNTRPSAKTGAGALFMLATLAGCGGSGSGDRVSQTPPSEVAFAATTASGTVSLSGVVLDGGAASVTAATGSLNRDTNAVIFSGLSGDITADRTLININGGGQATLTSTSDSFAARFQASPQNGASTTGIIGVATLAADMPSGSAEFIGDTRINAEIGFDTFELTGTATVTASFGSGGTVDATLTDLSGQRLPSLADAVAVSDVGTISLTGADIAGTAFAGGTSDTSGDILALSGGQSTYLAGQFFGPNATEAGAAFVINDTSNGTALIQGDFLVSQ